MNTAIAPNKRLDEIYGYVQGLTDAQLAQLIQKNPESTEATLALGQIQSRNDFRQRAQGQQGEAPTVKEGILGLATNQNNQDPRLMAGMGSMPMTPRDSMDTPMNGIASLPAQQMQMADGGIVRGLPNTMGSTETAYGPQVNPYGQAVAGATGLAGLYNTIQGGRG